MKLEKELKNLGLSDKEAKVYLAAIQLGTSTVQKISQKAGVNRATTYVIIDGLMQRGLMSTFDEGKKTFYAAEKPERLVDYFQEQDKELKEKISQLKEILPEMTLLFNDFSDKPKVKYYEGVEGLKAVYRDFSEGQKRGDLIYAAIPLDEFDSSILARKLLPARRKRVKKGIKMNIIYTSRKGKQMDFEKDSQENMQECKYVDFRDYPFRGGMNIYGNKIFMIDYRGRLGGIVIENKTLAQLMKSLFKLIWDSR